MQLAPFLVRPLKFVLPHEKKMRPLWIVRLGLFLYDHLNKKNTLPHSRFIHRLKQSIYFKPLKKHLNKGFSFYDCATDDARLTITNALQAKQHGAKIMTQTALIQASVINNLWQLTLQTTSGTSFQVLAKSIINAAGPWIETVNRLLDIPLEHTISLVKGSHIVIPKLYDGEHAYLLQNNDERVVFAIPYHGHTMIGTTDVPLNQTLDEVTIESSEIDYLFTLISHFFNKQLTRQDIIHSWSGVRTLLSSDNKIPSQLSREYAYYASINPAPSVTIYSG